MLDKKNFGKYLPTNWALIKLDTICEIFDRQRIPINVRDRDKRIAGKNENQLFPYYGATGQVGWIDDYIFDGEHILLGEDGAPFLDPFKNKAYIVNGQFWVNNHAHILKSYGSNKYLCHFLNQLDYRYYVTGTTRLKLNQASMKQIPVKFPPLPEQHRIVAKIEELFSKLDNGIENLQKAREQLKTYRQAVLKYAFEGKLTKEWRTLQRRAGNPPEPAEKLLEQIKTERERHYQKQLEDWKKACKQAKTEGKKKPVKPKKPKELPPLTDEELKGLPKLPERWIYFKSEGLSDFITKGTTPQKDELFNIEGDVPFIKVYNLTNKGVLDFSINPTFVSKKTHNGFLLRSVVFPGDVLMNIVGPPLGKVSLVPHTYKEWNINQAIVRFRPYSILYNKFLQYYLLSNVTINNMIRKSKATAGQFNLTLEICRNLEIPLCSPEEQHAIVQEIESRLSVCDKLEQTIEDSLKKAEALRQSILKKAFAGELTKDWREKHPELIAGENSAEKLLEKIKAEKARADTSRKKPRSKKTKKK